ncbi:hypothetical protein [Janthinobacterium sp. HLS12-2]|uniref:hypothetical protein n=1 Tax=Janthinobacterium sp. HLS12-2 TaxID=1259324 RepID=UPI003F251B08
MSEKGRLEKIGGSAAVTVGLAGIAAAIPLGLGAETVTATLGIATIVASVLPPALQKVVSDKTEARLEEKLQAIRRDIEELRLDVSQVSDDQIKLTLDCASAIYFTIDPAKLEYLRHAIRNNLADPTVSGGVPEALGRLIRDITVPEVKLVEELFHFTGIYVVEKDTFKLPNGTYSVEKGSADEIAVTGLIRLGLLTALSPSWDATKYSWSPMAAKLIALIKQKSN